MIVNFYFLITSVGMAVMLLWAGAYKMTAPGPQGIVPLVSNSPLISWLLSHSALMDVQTDELHAGHKDPS